MAHYMLNDRDSATEEYDPDDEYWSAESLSWVFEAVPSRTRPNCYSFRKGGNNATIYPTIWSDGNIRDVDLGAIEEAQIKLIKEGIKKNIKKEELRPEAEEKAFACLEKRIGRSPVHRRRSTFGGGKSTRKKRKKRKPRKRKRKKEKSRKRKKKKSRKSKKNINN